MAIPTDMTPEISEHAAAPHAKHPLDPLYAAELDEAVRILRREKYLGENVRIGSINLIEPAKALIETYQPGSPFERKALAVLLDRSERASYEAVVDLVAKSVPSVTPLPSGVQPSVMLDEFGECEEAVRRSPLFLEALKKRGVTDADLVMVDPWSAGDVWNGIAGRTGTAENASAVLPSIRAERQRLRAAHRQHGESWWISTRWK